MSLTQALCQLIRQKSFTTPDYQRAYLHLLDWVGCAAIGATTDAGKAFQKSLALSHSGSANAIFVGHFDWQSAVLYNGALGNILEMDDIHRSSILHPGPVIIPAALAVAQQQNRSFEQLLEAIIVGYEVAIRIGQSIGRSHYKHFHNTATCAGFGAAYASCYLFECDQPQTISALGNLGSRSSGLWQMRFENVMTKQWHNANAAQMGAQVAWLAKCGVTGVASILEGEVGLFNVLTQDADPIALLEPSAEWLIYQTSFKPWPACRHAHPAIDAFLGCVKKLPEQAKITAVNIRTYQDAITFCSRPHPQTTSEAKFSIQHAIAAIIEWGVPELHHYDEDKLALEQINKHRDRVSVKVSATMEANYPQHYGASCQLIYQQNNIQQVIEHRCVDTYGDPQVPMSASAIKHKARILMTRAGISSQRINAIAEFNFDENTRVQAFSQLLVPQVQG